MKYHLVILLTILSLGINAQHYYKRHYLQTDTNLTKKLIHLSSKNDVDSIIENCEIILNNWFSIPEVYKQMVVASNHDILLKNIKLQSTKHLFAFHLNLAISASMDIDLNPVPSSLNPTIFHVRESINKLPYDHYSISALEMDAWTKYGYAMDFMEARKSLMLADSLIEILSLSEFDSTVLYLNDIKNYFIEDGIYGGTIDSSLQRFIPAQGNWIIDSVCEIDRNDIFKLFSYRNVNLSTGSLGIDSVNFPFSFQLESILSSGYLISHDLGLTPSELKNSCMNLLTMIKNDRRYLTNEIKVIFEGQYDSLINHTIKKAVKKKDRRATKKILSDFDPIDIARGFTAYYDILEFRIYTDLFSGILRESLGEKFMEFNYGTDIDVETRELTENFIDSTRLLLYIIEESPSLGTEFYKMLLDEEPLYIQNLIALLNSPSSQGYCLIHSWKALNSLIEVQLLQTIYNRYSIKRTYSRNLEALSNSIFNSLFGNSFEELKFDRKNHYVNFLVTSIFFIRHVNNQILSPTGTARGFDGPMECLNPIYYVTNQRGGSFSISITNDSLFINRFVHGPEILNLQESEPMFQAVSRANTSFRRGDWNPYSYFIVDLLYNGGLTHLVEKYPGERIKIIADGEYSSLNWTIVNDGIQGIKQSPYFLTVSNSLFNTAPIRFTASPRIAAIYNLDYDSGLPNKNSRIFGTRGSTKSNWIQLNGTVKEVRNIEKHVPRLKHIEKRTSISEIYQCLAQEEIVHFATHASFIPNHFSPNSSSFLVLDSANHFVQNGDSSTYFSTHFDIGDVIGTPEFNCKLVILSACNSGKGSNRLNNFSINLPKAFIGQGADAVIASFWEVDDEGASLYFDTFYEELTKLQDVEQAFNATRGSLKARNVDPSLVYSFDLIIK